MGTFRDYLATAPAVDDEAVTQQPATFREFLSQSGPDLSDLSTKLPERGPEPRVSEFRALPDEPSFGERISKLLGPDTSVVPGGSAEAIAQFESGRGPGAGKRDLEEIGAKPDLLERGLHSFASGAITTGSGLAGMLSRVGVDSAAQVKSALDTRADDLLPADPKFMDSLLSGFGSTSTFFIPGMGIAKGAQAVAQVAPKIALWLGAGASAGMEAAVESGMVYDNLRQRGYSHEVAASRADKAFWTNAALLTVTNKFGLFGESGSRLIKGTLSAIMEGGQEGAQQVISNVAEGREDPFEGVGESMAVGALVGGGFGALTAGPENVAGGGKPDPVPSAVAQKLKQRGWTDAQIQQVTVNGYKIGPEGEVRDSTGKVVSPDTFLGDIGPGTPPTSPPSAPLELAPIDEIFSAPNVEGAIQAAVTAAEIAPINTGIINSRLSLAPEGPITPPVTDGIPFTTEPPVALPAALESQGQAELRAGRYEGGIPFEPTEIPRRPLELVQEGQETTPQPDEGIPYTPKVPTGSAIERIIQDREEAARVSAESVEKAQGTPTALPRATEAPAPTPISSQEPVSSPVAKQRGENAIIPPVSTTTPEPEAPQEAPEPKQARRLPPNFRDPRLLRNEFRGSIQVFVNGLTEGGGIGLIGGDFSPINKDVSRDKEMPVQRTPSVNPDWYKNLDGETKLPVDRAKRAIQKALDGKLLGAKEKRFVQFMLDEHTDGRLEYQLPYARRLRKEAGEVLFAKGLLPIETYQEDIANAGTLFEEASYNQEWDQESRSLFELATEAAEHDQAAVENMKDSLDPQEAAKQFYEIIARGRNERENQSRTPEGTGELAEGTPAETPAPAAEETSEGLTLTQTAAPVARAPQPSPSTPDLFGQDTTKQQAIADKEREVNARLGSGREVVPVESAGDMFDAGRAKQSDITDWRKDRSPAYLQAYDAHAVASQEHREISDQYRKKEVGDKVFLASKSRLNKASQALDVAEKAEIAEKILAKKSARKAKPQPLSALLPDYFKPGRIVKGYFGMDKVLEFVPATKDKGFEVKVVEVADHTGKPVVGAQPRWHSTMPDRKVVESVLAKEQQAVEQPTPAALPVAEKKETAHEYSSTQTPLPDSIAKQVKDAASTLIAKEDIHEEEGLEENPHITIKYGLHTDDINDVEPLLQGVGPIQATFGDIEIFSPEDETYDVVVQRVTSPDLRSLNKKLSDNLEVTDTYPDYKPHITLGYVKRGSGVKYKNLKSGMEGQGITLDTVEFSGKNGNLEPIKLLPAKQSATMPVAESIQAPATAGPVKYLDGDGNEIKLLRTPSYGFRVTDATMATAPDENGVLWFERGHYPAKGIVSVAKVPAAKISDQAIKPVNQDPITVAAEKLSASADKLAAAADKLAGVQKQADLIPAINTEDAGKELSANRRNKNKGGMQWGDIADKNEALRVAETTKQNVYSRPDYEALINDGMDPIVAHIVKQVYDSIAAKPVTRAAPTDTDLQLYIDGVNQVMNGIMEWASNREAVRSWVKSQVRVTGAMLGKATSLGDLVTDKVMLPLELAFPQGWRNSRDMVRIVGGNKVLGALQPGYTEATRATKAIKEGWPSKQEAWQRSFIILPESVRNDDIPEAERTGEPQERHFIKHKNAQWKVAKGSQGYGYATYEAAVEAARVLSKRDGGTQVSDKGISVTQAERIGEARRLEGEDISSEQLRDTFGFTAINFGNWMKGDANLAERQLHLNHAYDSFMDLAELLGVPPKAISLNGMMGVAIGAQGSGGNTAAHFVPGVNEINLTRTSGAGSLGHEFGHAVDHYFATQAGLSRQADPFLTEHTTGIDTEGYTKRAGQKVKAFGEGIRTEIVSAFRAIVEAMNVTQETEAQTEARITAANAKTQRNIDGWLKNIKRDYLAQQVDEARFDALAERIRTMDLGDGAVRVGNTNLSMAVDELRQLYKDKTGRLYSLDTLKSLQANIDHARYTKARQVADQAHVPQQVATEYSKAARKLDAKKQKPYWSTNLEKFARAFDAFISDKLEAIAAKNSYLSHTDRQGETVPAGEERKAINKAFDTLISELKTKETDQGVALFSLSDDTRRIYNQRIDELFAGDVADPEGIKVLDSSDVLGLLGYENLPVHLAEGKVIAGQYNHKLTAAHWKKIPQWLEDPVAVFDSDTRPELGRLVFIAPELHESGVPISMIIEPDTDGEFASIHMLLNAYERSGSTPFNRWAKDGLLRYLDQEKSPMFNEQSGRQLPGTAPRGLGPTNQSGRQLLGTGLNGVLSKVATQDDLVKYRAEHDGTAHFDLSRLADTTTFTKAQAQAVVSKSSKILSDSLGLKINVIESADIPAPVKAQVPAGKFPKGFNYQGQVYLVADALENARDAQLTFAHEVIGHAGMNSIMGPVRWKALQTRFNGLKKVGGKQVQELLQEVHRRNPGAQEDAALELKEFIAIAAEQREAQGPVARFIQQVVEMLRKALRAIGLPRPFSMADINAILGQSTRYLKGQEANIDEILGTEEETGYQTATEAAFSTSPESKVFYSQLLKTVQEAPLLKAAAIDRWNEISKPESVREQMLHYFGSELAIVTPLEIVDTAMLAALENNKIVRAVIESIPIDVVDILSSNGFTPNQLISDPDMVGDGLPIDIRPTVARGLASALQLVGARLRTALNRVLSSESTLRDQELIPTIHASDLNSRIVMRLLTPFGGTNIRIGDAGPILDSAVTGTKSPGLSSSGEINLTGEYGKLSTAELTEFLNRHAQILSDSTGNPITDYIVLPPPAMQGQPLFAVAPQTDSPTFKKWFGKSVVTVDGKPGSEPLVVYHGTGADIEVFDNTKARQTSPVKRPRILTSDELIERRSLESKRYYKPLSDREEKLYQELESVVRDAKALPGAKNTKGVAWFTSAPEVAGGFAGHQDGTVVGGVKLGNSNIIPVYLRMENPFMDTTGRYAKFGGLNQFDVKTLKEAGFDGVIWPESDYDLPDTTDQGPVKGYRRNRFGQAFGEDIPYPSQYAVFDPTQIKSATGNRGTFSPEDPNILFSLEDRDPPYVRRLKQQQGRTVATNTPAARPIPAATKDPRIDKARKNVSNWLRRNLTKEGLMTKMMFETKLQSDAMKNVGEEEIAYLIHGFEKSLKTAYKTKYNDISAAALGQVNDYLGGKDVQLPAGVRESADRMRDFLDVLSDKLITSMDELLEVKVAALSDKQRDSYELALSTDGEQGAIPESIAGILTLQQTITGNLGTYLNRSYQAFDDPAWKDKALADKALMAQAEAFILEKNPDLTDAEVTGAIRAILQGAAYNGNFLSFISKGTKIGSKDVSILKRRKEVPAVIRALLGEYKDPKVNFARSASKMQWLLANHYFLMGLRQQGLDDIFHLKPTGEYDAMIATKGSESMNPLDGLYTTTEIRQGMEDALDKFDGSELMRNLIRANSFVKYGKTILSPTTQARNFQSAAFFTIMNGHFNWAKLTKAFKATKADLFTRDDAWKAYLNELIGLGVLHDNPYAGELRDAINDVAGLDIYSKGPFQMGKKALSFMQRLYQVGDDFWKIIGYENELKNQLATGLPLNEAQKKAAYRIRNGYPTYSMVPRMIKKIRRWPLIGAFVSFPYEIVRTTYNQAGFIKEDWSDNRPAAVRRILGFAIASSAAYAAAALSMALMGMDDDDDEAVRSMLPPWSRNSQLLYIGYDEDGLPQYIDLSYLDPYTYLKKPLSALMNDNNPGFLQRVSDALTEMLEPFVGTDIAAGTILELWSNKKASGGTIYNPEDTSMRQAKEIADYTRRSLQPGAISNAERIMLALGGETSDSGKEYKLGDEMAALAGYRAGTLNLSQSLIYKGYEFEDSKRLATSILSREAGGQGDVSDSDLESAFAAMQKARERSYQQMIRAVNGARKLGMDENDIRASLRGSGMTMQDIAAIINGRTPTWRMSPQFMQSAEDRAITSTANAMDKMKIRREMGKRRAYIRGLLKEQRDQVAPE